MALDEKKGIWKNARGKGRRTPKGRQLDLDAHGEVLALLGDRPRRRDLLIEFLHLIQDEYGHLSAEHIRALAQEMGTGQAEIYEVASFYAHFDLVKEGEAPPPSLTIRVCDSLSCELAGAEALQKALEDGLDPAEVRVLRAPCMGRCDTAPVLELGHNHIDHATPEKVQAAIAAGDTHAHIPDYEAFDAYAAEGGYETLKDLRAKGDWEAVQAKVKEAGLRGLGGGGENALGPEMGKAVYVVIQYPLPDIAHSDFIEVGEGQGRARNYILRVLDNRVDFRSQVMAGTRQNRKKLAHCGLT